jgi:N6-adenosine-specific RNA methylase IME4
MTFPQKPAKFTPLDSGATIAQAPGPPGKPERLRATDVAAITGTAAALVNQARAVLAEAVALPEIRTVKEWAGAAADHARRARRLSDAQHLREEAWQAEADATELRLQAWRREGDLLREMADNGQRHPGGKFELQPVAQTLEQLGYSNSGVASRAMEVAAIPEDVFAAYLTKVRARGEFATRAGLIRHAVDSRRRGGGQSPPLPDGRYASIVVDPPWPMGHSATLDTPSQGSTLAYPTMTLDQIRALPVQALGVDGSHLYLWAPQRFLPDAFDIAAEWGFTYHCLLTWVKPGGFTPFSWQFNAEHVVFAYRPPFRMAEMGRMVAFHAARGSHSTKPDVFYDLVEAVSFGPRIDLFARRTRPGWVSWGDEL